MNVQSTQSAQKILEQQMIEAMLNQMVQESSGSDQSFQAVMQSIMTAQAAAGNDMSASSLDNSLLNGLSSCGNSSLSYRDLINGIRNSSYSNLSAYTNMIKNVENSSNSSSVNPRSNAEIEKAIKAASQKYGVDENFIKAVIKQESSYSPNAVSSAGAMGLMQLMPSTAQSLGVTNPFDVNQNIDGGTKYLSQLLNMFGNSKELALAGYNAGPNAVNNSGYNISRLPSETRNYVATIMGNYNNNQV